MSGKNGNGAKPDVWEWDWNEVNRADMKAMMKAYSAAQKAAKEAEEKGEDTDVDPDAVAFPIMTRVIKQWPFAMDHSDVTTYDKLGLADYAEVVKRFWATFPGSAVSAESTNSG